MLLFNRQGERYCYYMHVKYKSYELVVLQEYASAEKIFG